MPVKNGVIQGYLLVKQPKPPLLKFAGKPIAKFNNVLGLFIKRPHRYESLRWLACVYALAVGIFIGARTQSKYLKEWEKNMRIQKKLHPAGMWAEENAVAAAEKLGAPKPTHPMRIFEGGFQMFELKPKIFDPDEEHH
eukprot:RCo025170